MPWSLTALSLAAVLVGGPTTAAKDPAGPATAKAGASPAAEAPGAIVLGPAAEGEAVIVDADGHVVAHVTLVPGRATTIGVPAGHYGIETAGRRVADVEVGAGETIELLRPPSLTAVVPPEPTPPPPLLSETVVGRPPPSTAPDGRRGKRGKRKWKPVVAPLASVVLPGAGQVITKRPGRGMAFFTGTVAMTVGAAALWASGNPREGAARDDEGDAGAVEVIRLGGVAGLSGAAALLYFAQILDAYGGAVGKTGKKIKPATDHVVAFEVQRSTTVGFAAGQPEYKLFSDYSLAVMGQAARRVTVGASDLSIKLEPERSGVVVQGGVRSAYRFWDRRRVWLSAGGGIVLQGVSARRPAPDTSTADAGDEGRFSAFLYAMLDARIFILDRWAVMVTPRISLPFSERRFGRDRTIARLSTTFELALGGAVHF